eukprot:gene2152-2018_t
MEVTFTTTCDQIEKGESLHILGESEELGKWKNNFSQKLEKNENSEFKVSLKITSSILIYKYIIKKEGVTVRWEAENRKIETQKEIKDKVDIPMTSDCKFGVHVIKMNSDNIKTNLKLENIQMEFKPGKKTASTFNFPLMEFYSENFGDIDFKIILKQQEKIIGRVVVVSKSFRPFTCAGKIDLPIIDDTFEMIGEINIPFLIITPFRHENNNLRNVKKHKDWKSDSLNRPFIFIGHRGSGTTNTVGKKPFAAENTILSFMEAHKGQSNFVEFDVQLTKCKKPIIYHDFTLGLCLNESNIFTLPIHQSRFENLQNSKFIPRIHKKAFRDHESGITKNEETVQRLVDHKVRRTSFSEFIKTKNNITYPQSDPMPVHDFIPTFKEMFEKLPENLGFDIEVKYPLYEETISLGFDSFTDRNVFADAILKIVFDFAHQKRKIFFSCFDPDLCILLATKQATFPVFFLTEAGETIYLDSRCNSIEEAIKFVQLNNLQGIISDSTPLLRDKGLVESVVDAQIPLMSYGSALGEPEVIKMMSKKGLVGLCCDKISSVIKNYEDSILKE